MTRPLQRTVPRPVTDLDNDTITDVYQEIFTAGVELANEGLLLIAKEGEGQGEESLMELASRGKINSSLLLTISSSFFSFSL